VAFQRPKNNPLSPYYNPGWGNHPNFSLNSGPNAVLSNSQLGMFPGNNSQPMSYPSHSSQRPAF